MADATHNRLTLYLPLLAFLAVWASQLIYFLSYENRTFYVFQVNVLAVIAVAVTSYVIGFLFARLMIHIRSRLQLSKAQVSKGLSRLTVLRMVRLSLVLSGLVIFSNIVVPIVTGSSLAGARQLALENWDTGSVSVRMIAVLVNVTIAITLIAIMDYIDVSESFPLILLIVFILLTIAAYSRAHLLLGLCVVGLKWISKSNYKMSFILIAFSGFAVLFSIISVISNINSGDGVAEFDGLIKSLEIYAFGGVAGFEYYYSTGYPQFSGFLTIPRFVYYFVPGLGSIPPSYFPFIDTTPPINIFSAMYPPFHDFGILGLGLLFSLYGLISALIIDAFENSGGRLLGVLAGFYLYASIMSPFDDQFIRGSTVLILLVIGVFVYNTLFWLLSRPEVREG